MEFKLENILRENIKQLVPYSSARSEFKGKGGVFLDANENSFGSPFNEEENFNRYPDPVQLELKKKIESIKGLPTENIFIGNGSDEAIDIVFRAFCKPGKDNVIVCPPTYGMYEVSAAINDVEVKRVELQKETFQLDVPGILKAIDANTKLIFVCNPNNPTGTSFEKKDTLQLIESFSGIIVIDEAYINYSSFQSFISCLTKYSNVVILQTLSKAWGLAGLRVGMAFASQQIIEVFNKIKPPYNVNEASQQLAIKALDNVELVNKWIKETVLERKRLECELAGLSFAERVYQSEANFLLVKVKNANEVYQNLVESNIIVRNRSSVRLCEDCIRITIGTKSENNQLLNALRNYGK